MTYPLFIPFTPVNWKLIILSGLSASLGFAATDIPVGDSMLTAGLADFTQSSSVSATVEIVSAETHPDYFSDTEDLSEAALLTVPEGAADPWNTQWGASLSLAVSEGDVGLVRFFIKAVEEADETGQVYASAIIQESVSPWSKSLTQQVTGGAAWREIILPFTFDASYAAGGTTFFIWLGSAGAQKLLIGGVEVIHYGTAYTEEELPKTGLTYAGREPDAAWRAEALARIEQVRKGDIQVTVVDAAGDPVEGVSVSVDMTRQQFKWGMAISGYELMHGAERDVYRDNLLMLFNTITIENGLKWPPFEGNWGSRFDFETVTLPALQWLKSQGFFVHGHVLVWPGLKNLPNSVETAWESNRSAVPQMVTDHIAEVLGATEGLVDEWDVLNEPWDNHDIMDVFGDGLMVDWFNQTRELFPRGDLLMNEYGILSGGTEDSEHKQDFESNIAYLLEGGAPLTMIGMQGHFGDTVTAPETLLKILNRFDRFGLPIRVTEFDVDATDREFQADYFRDFLITLYSWPSVTGIIQWAYADAAAWKAEAALFDENWNLRPHGEEYVNWVLGEWWSNESGVTDADGRVTLRGHKGTYRLSLVSGDEQHSVTVNLAGPSIEVTVPLAGASVEGTYLGGGWVQSDGLGLLKQGPAPWMYSPDMGWLYVASGGTNDGVWFWSEAEGWRWTTHRQEGWIYRADSGELEAKSMAAPLAPVQTGPFKDAIHLWSDWYLSPWFGAFMTTETAWVYHERVGWIYVIPDVSEGLWIYSQTKGWMWTASFHFNAVYVESSGLWEPLW